MVACDQTVDYWNKRQFELYAKLIDEETNELKAAIAENNPVEILDALIDILVVTTGAVKSIGVDAERAWDEVMRTNFAKIDESTGKVRKREDGKVLKPLDWQPPQLESFLTSFPKSQ